jgi:DNA primase
MSFSVSKNTYRCFVCGAHGGTIDLVMKYQRLGFKEACDFLNDGASFKYEIRNTKDEKLQPSAIRHQTSFDASRYERYFERPFLNDEARKFLFEERRLDSRVVRWCRLTSWKDRKGVPWLQIPYYNQEGKLIGIQNRRLRNENENDRSATQGDACQSKNENQTPRFRFPQGSQCGIYNLPVLNRLKPGDELYITEGCSDCWAMLSSGHKAIAIPSATLLTKKDSEILKSLTMNHETLTVHMFPDRDVPGERLFLQLQKVLPSLVHHQLPPGCKDFGEYYLRQ